MSRKTEYDVIVIGAGHAGIEASFAAAKLDRKVLLITLDIDAIGKLSCNPAVGGVSKGNLVREIDALGGLIGRIADECALNYRRLNKSKGKAVWATRAQVDRFLYPKTARSIIENDERIRILSSKVNNIITKSNKVLGIETNYGEVFYGKTVIVCAGTFLKSTIHIGMNSFPGGRLNEPSSNALFNSILKLGFAGKHFKTGTCARLDKRTIDFSKMVEQPPEYDVEPFSYLSTKPPKKQMSCFITYTNEKTHKIIMRNLSNSPLYSGKIKSKGVRYCPSLEDKVVKFSDKNRHQVFIEPEGKDSLEVYPNGISSSLPLRVQIDFIHTIEGLENARIFRPGYGIEHGVIDSRQLYPTLESKMISGLYFAGQVNGTTGYEEAAAQGIVAGVNAALKTRGQKPFVVRRDVAFIGVLIDDLTSRGTDEPYRMFTSRSEFRVSIRESNADIRLSEIAYKTGLISKERYSMVLEKKERINKEIKRLKSAKVIFRGRKISLYESLKMPHVSYDEIGIKPVINDSSTKREVEIMTKYEGFLKRQEQDIKVLNNLKKIKIPKRLDFENIPSLSREVRDKLKSFKPNNLDDAFKISGVTPAAIVQIYNFINKKR